MRPPVGPDPSRPSSRNSESPNGVGMITEQDAVLRKYIPSSKERRDISSRLEEEFAKQERLEKERADARCEPRQTSLLEKK